MDILRIGALGIVAAVLSVVIKQYRPELAMQIALALGVVIFLFLSAQLSGISSVVKSLFEKANIEPEYFLTIMKATGIAFITEFAASACKDAGEASIAQKVEIGGKVLIVFLALPLLMALLQKLLKIM
jgi:stage III sporulation protein AD